MKWLKIIKFIIISVTLVPPLMCLSKSPKEIYQALVNSAKIADATKFNKLYSEIELSINQKQELLAILEEMLKINHEYCANEYPKLLLPKVSKELIKKELKTALKNSKHVFWAAGTASCFAMGLGYWHYAERKKIFDQNLANVDMSAPHYTFINSTIVRNYNGPAEHVARMISYGPVLNQDLMKMCLLISFGGPILMALGALRFRALNKVLNSYRRWKQTMRIKHILLNWSSVQQNLILRFQLNQPNVRPTTHL